MQVKLAAVLARFSQGERLDVRATCRQLGISPPTFYKYAARFDAEGVAGLSERSRRPRSSPGRTPAAVEEEILRWRTELLAQGWDAGAQSIYYRMRRAGQRPPSARTVHRVLVRHGLVEPSPAKRPRSSYRRFAYPRTNDCWQVDATECTLADGTTAVVFHLLDDCSRKALNSHAAPSETSEGACACATAAITAFGVPAMFLSDNGTAFSAKARGGVSALEQILRILGVNAVTSRPYHPQTCGKTERYHQTFKRWLDAQPTPATLTELQALADRFDHLYNTERPHSAHDGATPQEIWASRDRCPPPTSQTPFPTVITTATVSSRGAIQAANCDIQVGRDWEAAHVTVITTGDHVQILHGRHLVRELTVDRTRHYQPLGRKRSGSRKRPRIVSTMS